jgi:hypothetical protein
MSNSLEQACSAKSSVVDSASSTLRNQIRSRLVLDSGHALLAGFGLNIQLTSVFCFKSLNL